MTATAPASVIHIIDDEAAFRRSLAFLLESAGWMAVEHESAEAFLGANPLLTPDGGCLVLDIRMPRISGLELQRRLTTAGSAWPIVFITGHGDVDLAVQAMKDGAADFLQKPFKDQQILNAVERAVCLSLIRQEANRRCNQARDQLTRLSPREAEIARYLALGFSNKEIARELSISDNTVHVHRQHIMDKTDTGSAAELACLILRVDPSGLD
ncbi:MAG: response regulator [Thiobacillus sp.]|nr:response regulator [Thiobacillus sp.]MDP2977479.1 response regulator [Thiobacillus sp.]